uniref:Uncharacterized protein n=1 Tax=Anguilla anguilla TaxID=7936 RepID=A0A0E9XDV4_ANGAN
MRYRWQGHP